MSRPKSTISARAIPIMQPALASSRERSASCCWLSVVESAVALGSEGCDW
jgi:hypothetical protein